MNELMGLCGLSNPFAWLTPQLALLKASKLACKHAILPAIMKQSICHMTAFW